MDKENETPLPSPQGIALAIMQACQRDDVSVQEISRLVQQDPALMGRLLAHANAAQTGMRPCVSAQDAVARVGLHATRQLSLSFSLIDQYSQGRCAAFDYPGFWSHSLLMAVTLRHFGAALRLGSPDELFSYGLLARVGCLAMATAYPDEYASILAAHESESELLRHEQAVLRTDHLQLSTLLQTRWGLPAPLVQPIAHHEDPAAAHFEHGTRSWSLLQLLHLTWRLANVLLQPKVSAGQSFPDLLLLAGTLGLAEPDFYAGVDAISAEWQASAARFKLPSQPIQPFATLAQACVRPDQEPDAQWLRVLVVEDDRIICRVLETWLRDECHYTVKTAGDGRAALALAAEFNPHVILTDWLMPVMNGLELCRTLRATEWGQSIYVLMLTSMVSESELVTAFESGVDDYLTKPVNMRALSARLTAAWRFVRLREAWERDHERLTKAAQALALTNRQLQHAALSDPLTDLCNRRAGHEALTQAWSTAARYQSPLCVISIDIDHFKAVNDHWGHAAGDLVLQAVSQALRTAARREDTVCRWGGEEFLLICPNLKPNDAALAGFRLRDAIHRLRIPVSGTSLQVTISLGIAAWHAGLPNPDHLIAEADQSLYVAKNSGRNRVVLAWDLSADRQRAAAAPLQ
ncbi:MAG: diguanylate cyclase [Rhodoferax sp.]|nr:diguanylate cyclase [Rhodoferax sp.]